MSVNLLHVWYARLIEDERKHSPDRSTKVACVVTDDSGEPLFCAHNDFPPGVEVTEAMHERPAKYDWTEHAERNAIYDAARRGQALAGCRIVLPGYPCAECARAIIRAGLVEVMTFGEPMDPRWGHSQQVALEMLAKAGVTVSKIE